MAQGMCGGGCAKSIREVRAVVGAIVAKNNLDHVTVSHGWWDRFRARHPHLQKNEPREVMDLSLEDGLS